MARITQAQINMIKEAAAPLRGTPYAYSYVSAPTETDIRVVFQHTVALTVAEALEVIAVGKAHLADGTAEWSDGTPYTAPQIHKAVPVDDRLTESSCQVCGDTVRSTWGGSGRTWVHADGHIASSRPPIERS